jgi:hypothetical protein
VSFYLVIARVFQVSGGAGNSLLAGDSSPLDAGKKGDEQR